jgi:hypothetical protein
MTIGADPEFFLYDNGRIVPSIGIIPGTKQAPHLLGDDDGEGYFCHEDNVTIELGIPILTQGENLGNAISYGKRLITEEFLSSNQSLYANASSIEFTPTQLTSEQAQTFGCEPDFDAYTAGKVRDIPNSLKKSNWRSAGGHIHLGGNFNCPPFVVALLCDVFLSVKPYIDGYNPQSTLGSHTRMKHYGRPGIFRPKPYGIEYRTPSTWWCVDESFGNYIGMTADRLVQYLEAHTGTTIRSSIAKIPWLEVKQLLSYESDVPREDKLERAHIIMDQVKLAGLMV